MTMAMRFAEDHGVGLMGAVTAAITGASVLAVQWLGEGGAITAGVSAVGAIATICYGWVRQMRTSFRAQVEAQARAFDATQKAQAGELAAARARIAELEHRLDEKDEAIDELRAQLAQVLAAVNRP
jgi:uncharacterized membrane protein YcjF (UPF0283 family)